MQAFPYIRLPLSFFQNHHPTKVYVAFGIFCSMEPTSLKSLGSPKGNNYVWNVPSVLADVSKSAQEANHSPQLQLKAFMFDIPLQCSTARNLLLSASLPSFPSIDYKCFCPHVCLGFLCSACCCQQVCREVQT